MVTHASDGHSLIAVVAGEAGIGKSRLVAELAVDVHADGGRVLLGSCYEEAYRPYEPFVQVLDEQAATLPAAELRRRVGGRQPLSLIAPADAGPSPIRPRPTRTAGPRVKILDALVGYLTGPRRAPVLLVIEDLHWSTSTTQDAPSATWRVASPTYRSSSSSRRGTRARPHRTGRPPPR